MNRLRAEALTFRYPAGFSLGPVDLDLGPGLHLLSGPNGSGKTTLLKISCGVLRPTSGRVRVCGGDPLESAVRRRVSLLPAHPDLPGFLRVDEAWQTLAALRGAPDWDGAPLCDALGLPGALLLDHASAGQRRKAELVAALAGDPPVLLLDEPFANLDPDACGVLAGWIGVWRAERVVVLAGQDARGLPLDGVADVAPGRPVRMRPPGG